MPPKVRSPRHDDERLGPLSPSAAASGTAHDAPRPSATNRTAPVPAGRGAAVEGEAKREHDPLG